jgi:CheY-like chemotaxis protein
MPVLDGVAATRRITALQKGRPAHVPVPVIGLSASVESTDDWRAAGMTYMLGKPFKRKDMRHVLVLVDARKASSFAPDSQNSKLQQMTTPTGIRSSYVEFQ